jgi:hypothetical protein
MISTWRCERPSFRYESLTCSPRASGLGRKIFAGRRDLGDALGRHHDAGVTLAQRPERSVKPFGGHRIVEQPPRFIDEDQRRVPRAFAFDLMEQPLERGRRRTFAKRRQAASFIDAHLRVAGRACFTVKDVAPRANVGVLIQNSAEREVLGSAPPESACGEGLGSTQARSRGRVPPAARR